VQQEFQWNALLATVRVRHERHIRAAAGHRGKELAQALAASRADPRVYRRAPGDRGGTALAVHRVLGDGGTDRGHVLVQAGVQSGMAGREAVQRALADLASQPQADDGKRSGHPRRRIRRTRFFRHNT